MTTNQNAHIEVNIYKTNELTGKMEVYATGTLMTVKELNEAKRTRFPHMLYVPVSNKFANDILQAA